ncbi:MAG TPA: HNH endonuclease signature motif containing protein [Solirubrobacteraceae bacterium]|nr:HNH endonuclease signature motif containing protein [Solirubrobacteraceae bacterium]
MKYIRGHNSTGMDRSGARKTHYVVEARGHETPCWTWQLGKTLPNKRSTGGYGKLRHKGKEYLAHRWYYEQAHGPITAGLELDHLCHNVDCVNPSHLEPVTHLENVRRSRSMRLTPDEAQRIEWLVNNGHAVQEVADLFCVSGETVRLIRVNGAEGPRRG